MMKNEAIVGKPDYPIAVILSAGANGMGAVRGLKRMGVPCVVVGIDPDDPVLLSRHPQKKIVTEFTELLRVLHDFAATSPRRRPVLIPTSDRFVSFLSQNQGELQDRFDVCIAAPALSETLIDKAEETALIEESGLPLPATVRNLSVNADSLVRLLGLPLIIKPRSFKYANCLGRKNVLIARIEDLKQFLTQHSTDLHGLLAQEVIQGHDDCLWVCNCTFNRNHELASAFTFQRLRLSPSHYGVTSYAISRRNEEIIKHVARLGKAIEFVGPAMVEFKFDARDGQYKYIELNPRLGMCNYFDTSCGVLNAYNAYQIARGDQPIVSQCQASGVMYLSLWDEMYSRFKDGETAWSMLWDYFRHSHRRHVFPFFEWSDPLPGVLSGVRDLLSLAKGMLRKVSATRRSLSLPETGALRNPQPARR